MEEVVIDMVTSVTLEGYRLPETLVRLLERVSGRKVAVGLSGGVDSAVVVLLLKRAGADVVGVTMEHLPGIGDIGRRMAVRLGIEIEVVDVKDEFDREVVEYFIDEYAKGRTPNPCVVCNRLFKFGVLRDYAIDELNADYYATGHYVRLETEGDHQVVKRGVDIAKDQSYALAMVPKEKFDNVIFPLGYMHKRGVRTVADAFGVRPVLNESQDLCFLKGDRIEFMKRRRRSAFSSGKIVDESGSVLGFHKGVAMFAIGQRKGLGINRPIRYYVKEIDAARNRVIAAEHDALYKREFCVKDVNWLVEPEFPMKVQTVIRNKMDPVPATVVRNGCRARVTDGSQCDDYIKVVCDRPVWAVAPGQLAVFYNDDMLLGGGWIVG